MMKKFFVGFSVVMLAFGLIGNADAVVMKIGEATYSSQTYSLIYDDFSQVVWLDYTKSYQTWSQANSWTSTLTLSNINIMDGYTTTADLASGWRLPVLAELQSLAAQLGNSAPFTPFANLVGTATDPFAYWSSTSAGTDNHATLRFATDVSVTMPDSMVNYAMAAHSAVFTSAAPVPEPATLLLLGSGLVGLAGLGRKKFMK